MDSFESVVVVLVSVWLAMLTLVVLMLVRQVGLVTVRLDRDRRTSAAVNDGLGIDEPLPANVADVVSVDDQGVGYLLVLGAVCAPCRELVTDLKGAALERPLTALISGKEELATAISELLPPGIAVVQDSLDGELAASLRIETTPFAFEIEDGHVRGKAVLHGAEHLLEFMRTRPGDSNGARLRVQEVNPLAKH